MKRHFNCTEIIPYLDTKISVHWVRNEYKKKSDIHIFEEDDGCTTIEKDYISFKYKGIEVQDNYESDEHDLGSRVFEICSIIDSGDLERLTEINVKWKISE